jgi:hypothetical protein
MAKITKFPKINRVGMDIKKILEKHGVNHPDPQVHEVIVQRWAEFGERYTNRKVNQLELMQDLAGQMIRIIELEHEVEDLKSRLQPKKPHPVK